MAFGDTFSGPNMTGDWRSNVLLLSDDTKLSDGLSLINTGPAYQFIPAARNQVFFIGSEVTNIPTSAVYANDKNYVNYMSVKSWDIPGPLDHQLLGDLEVRPGDRQVGAAALDRPLGGLVPVVDALPRRRPELPADGLRAATGEQGASPVNPATSTPSAPRPAGAGSAYLSRVPESAITDLKQYEYWDGNSVGAGPARGGRTRSSVTHPTPAGLFGFVIDLANNPNFFGGWLAGFTGAKTGGNVSEMSVQYNEYLDKYVVLYGNGAQQRHPAHRRHPRGPVVGSGHRSRPRSQYPGLYAPMIHPLSGTGELTDADGDPDVSNLYWNMSLWGNYNVVLMKTDLSPLKATPV